MKKTLLSTMAALLLLAAAPLVAQGPPPPAGPGGPGGPGGPSGQGGPGAPKEAVVTFLKLTDAQKAAAEELMTSMKGTLDALDVEIKANREAVDTEFAASQPDAATVGALVIAGRALEANVKVAHDDLDAKFAALLTDEQKSRLAIFKEVLEALRPPAGGPARRQPAASARWRATRRRGAPQPAGYSGFYDARSLPAPGTHTSIRRLDEIRRALVRRMFASRDRAGAATPC